MDWVITSLCLASLTFIIKGDTKSYFRGLFIAILLLILTIRDLGSQNAKLEMIVLMTFMTMMIKVFMSRKENVEKKT